MPLHDIRRFVPIIVTIAIVAAAWMLFIRPASSAASRDTARLQDLRARLAMPQARVDVSSAVLPATDPMAPFERRISSGDVTAELLASLTRLAIDAGTTNLFIDSAAAPVPVSTAGGASAAAADEPDPRVAFFGGPLQYSSIPMSFEASYTALGEFLWRLRDLPALVEIRGMTVKPRGSGEEGAGTGGARADYEGRLSVSLALYVYSRPDPAIAPAVLDGAAR